MRNRYFFTIALILFGSITALSAQQPELTLWWITDSHTHQGGHGNHGAVFFPSDTTYYIYYDGEDQELTFSIKNEGDAPLNLTLPLSLDQTQLPNFTITQQPIQSVLQPNEETHFVVQYDAGDFYVNQEGVLTIESDDLSNNDYRLNFGVGRGALDVTSIEGCLTALTEVENFTPTRARKRTYEFTLDCRLNRTEAVLIEESPIGTIDVRETTAFTYDANNNLIEQIIRTEEIGSPIETTRINRAYDANNRIIQRVETDPFGEEDVTTWTYDDNGNILTIIVEKKSLNGTVLSRTINVYTYDTNNNRLTTEVFQQNMVPSALSNRVTNTFDSNNRLMTSVSEFYSNGALRSTTTTTNTYDINGNLATTMIFSDRVSGNDSKRNTTFNYDGQNNLLVQTVMVEVPVGTPIGSAVTTNTYNSNGDIIRSTVENITTTGQRTLSRENIFTPCLIETDAKDINLNAVDPCSCEDPQNRTVNGEYLFHDILTVSTAPGRSVWLTANDGEFRDANNNPLPAGALPTSNPGGNAAGTGTGTLIPETSTPGVYQLPFFHRANVASTISYTDGAITRPFVTSRCADNCVVIPTMSEWGLLLFGLLVLNIGVFFVRRKAIV